MQYQVGLESTEDKIMRPSAACWYVTFNSNYVSFDVSSFQQLSLL